MVDVPAQIAAVTRTVRAEEVDGAPVRVQTIAQTYPTGIEDLWEATTTAERIARWFLPVSGDLSVGGRYQLQGNAGGEVISCTTPSGGVAAYAITWEFGGGVSWVNVRLAAEGAEETRFELEHIARVADFPDGMWETFGPGATGVGWDGGLLGLSLHVGAVEGVLSPDEAAAWATTDEGRAFYRGAADRWGAAHVAAGADPVAAQTAADATYGFYAGQESGA